MGTTLQPHSPACPAPTLLGVRPGYQLGQGRLCVAGGGFRPGYIIEAPGRGGSAIRAGLCQQGSCLGAAVAVGDWGLLRVYRAGDGLLNAQLGCGRHWVHFGPISVFSVDRTLLSYPCKSITAAHYFSLTGSAKAGIYPVSILISFLITSVLSVVLPCIAPGQITVPLLLEAVLDPISKQKHFCSALTGVAVQRLPFFFSLLPANWLRPPEFGGHRCHW